MDRGEILYKVKFGEGDFGLYPADSFTQDRRTWIYMKFYASNWILEEYCPRTMGQAIASRKRRRNAKRKSLRRSGRIIKQKAIEMANMINREFQLKN